MFECFEKFLSSLSGVLPTISDIEPYNVIYLLFASSLTAEMNAAHSSIELKDDSEARISPSLESASCIFGAQWSPPRTHIENSSDKLNAATSDCILSNEKAVMP